MTDRWGSDSPAARSVGDAYRAVSRLNDEWEGLRDEPVAWMEPATPAGAVLESIRFDPDRVLSGLVAACQDGYPLAGRIVVQALLPKVILMSRSAPYPTIDDLLSALWCRIAHYPLERRPAAIAANLVLDARKDVVAEDRPGPAAGPAPVRAPVTAAAILDAARRLRLVSQETLSIMELVYLDGCSSTLVGEQHGITGDAVRRRCSDTVRRLRDHRQTLLSLAAA